MTHDWRQGLPVIHGASAVLREPRLADAPALYACLTTPPVAQFISTPPASALGFERFIAWVQNERQVGRHACYAIVPHGEDEPVGLVQIREVEASFGTAEWGFAMAERYWGTGLFMECAHLVLDFAFRDARMHRLEARASVKNVRGNRVLSKLGACQEAILRESFANVALHSDQVLWALVADDWLEAHPEPARRGWEPVVQPPETTGVTKRLAPAPWRAGLPVLQGTRVALRELRAEDAETLAALMSDEDVRRFIPQPPATPADFVRFIQWTRSQHETGTVLSLGMVPEGDEAAVGVLQLHELEPPFRTAEWGFVLGRPYWGSGLFKAGAALFLQFAFETVGVHRIEARAMTANVRANEVLRHSGWTEEGHLRRSFLLGGTYHDDVLWALLRDDWMRQQTGSR